MPNNVVASFSASGSSALASSAGPRSTGLAKFDYIAAHVERFFVDKAFSPMLHQIMAIRGIEQPPNPAFELTDGVAQGGSR